MPDTHVLAERPKESRGQGQLAVYDAIVIGAGISGMYMLYRLRELGMTARVFEAGTGVGGTWYWNRYPGARFDSESWTYGYSFSKDLMAEWDWKEHFSPQPDTLEYLNYVADKFDLRRDIEFRSTVAAAHWDERANQWNVTLENGARATSRFLFTAIGILSAYTLPAIPGRESFTGPAYHPARWPHTPVDFRGKRVGIIGTGATAIQAIPEIAKEARHLTVFQRRPNWAAPLHNSRISKAEMAEIKSRYDEIYAHCATTPSWFIHQADPRRTLDVSPAEREAFWEKLLQASLALAFGWATSASILTNEEANAAISAFIAKKIRQRVKDPTVADKLIPKDHGFGTRRVPLESGYFEAYNRDNVTLIDTIADEPIECITPRGIKTARQEYEFDILIYATGFDGVTGAYDRIDIRGQTASGSGDRLGRNPAHLSRHARRRLPQPADGARPAHRARQHYPGDLTQRRIPGGPLRVHATAQLRPCGDPAAKSRRVDRDRDQGGRSVALLQGRFRAERRQPQRRRPDRAPRSGLQRQRRPFPADDRRGRQRRLPGIRVPFWPPSCATQSPPIVSPAVSRHQVTAGDPRNLEPPPAPAVVYPAGKASAAPSNALAGKGEK